MGAIMYALGSNGSGQLGIGHKEDVSVPREVLLDSGIPVSVSLLKAGGNHTLLLSGGILYCAGNYTSGACGILDGALLESKFCPVRLTDAKNSILNRAPIIFCAATWEASIIVVQDDSGCANKLYSFGTGLKGELGQGELLFRSAKAQLFEDFPPAGLEVRDLAASVAHVVAVLSNGDVYGWGNGRKGQLGVPAGIIYKPRKIAALDFKVVRATCGREFTCLLGESETGNLVVMGSDKWGVISSAPKIIPRWADVDAGWGSIHLLLQDGNVVSWGRGDHGQLAPFGLPRLVKIAIGSEHALGLTTDGRVLAWGWGEHGNCGSSTANGDVREKWNTIASSQYLTPGTKIFSIGAGYSTSWVCVKTFDN